MKLTYIITLFLIITIASAGCISAEKNVDIISLGAVGDGKTICDDAFSKAFNGSYNSVYITSGTYLVSSQIEITSDVLVYGDGESSVIKLKAGSGEKVLKNKDVVNEMSVFSIHDCADVIFQSFVIDANKKEYAENPEHLEICSRNDNIISVMVSNAENIKFSDMTIRNSLIEGIYLYDVGWAVIENSRFYGNGFYQEDASGIHLDGMCKNIKVTDCVSYLNGFHGYIIGTVSKVMFENCSAYDNGYEGFKIQYADNSEIKFSKIKSVNNTRHGMYITFDSSNIEITDAEFINNGKYGVVVFDKSSDITFSKLKSVSSGGFDLYFGQGVSNIKILDAELTENKINQIFEADSADIFYGPDLHKISVTDYKDGKIKGTSIQIESREI